MLFIYAVTGHFHDRAVSKKDCEKEKMTNLKNLMLCAIWYHLQHLKILKNTHGGV